MDAAKIQELNKHIGELFCVVTEHEIFAHLSPELKDIFKADADMIRKTKLWKWLIEEMKIEAEKKMFFDALTPDDMVGGKFMLYTLDVLTKKLDNLAK